jgi:hypothetical protein
MKTSEVAQVVNHYENLDIVKAHEESKKTSVTVRLPFEDIARLDYLANRFKTTRSSLCNDLISAAVCDAVIALGLDVSDPVIFDRKKGSKNV